MATLDDYAAVAPIMHAATDALAGRVLRDDVAAVVGVVRAGLEEQARISLQDAGVAALSADEVEHQVKKESWTLTVGELSAALGRPPATVHRWLAKAKEHGAVIDHEVGRGRPARLSLDQALTVGGAHIFPEPKAVAEWCAIAAETDCMPDDIEVLDPREEFAAIEL